jgi:hypothetical protein
MEGMYMIDEQHLLDTSTVKRDFTKINHHSQAQLDNADSLIEFIFGGNHNYIQISEAYLNIEITVRKADDADFADAEEIRLVNNALCYLFSEASLKTGSGKNIELIREVGRITTMYKMLVKQQPDLLTYFAKDTGDGAVADNVDLKSRIINNIANAANKGKLFAQLPLKDIFGFCDTFKKITYGLEFHLTLKRKESDDAIFSTINANPGIDITINKLELMVPSYIPSPETQANFLKVISNKQPIQLVYQERVTDRRVVNTGLEYQMDIGSSANINAPMYLIYAHQTANRSTSQRPLNPAIFDNMNVQETSVNIDTTRYPDVPYTTDMALNKYTDHYKNIELFYKEYIGEQILSPYISYHDWKTLYPIFITDLRFQNEYISPKKIQLNIKYRADPANARLYTLLIRNRIIEIQSDGRTMIDII